MEKKVISSLVWKFSERIIAQSITLIVSMVLARRVTVEEYGIVGIVMIAITIANVFVSNGIGSALIQKKDADDLDFSSVFYINFLVSILVYLGIYFFAPFISVYFDSSILCPMLRILGIRVIIASINSIQHAYVSKNMLFKKFFYSTLVGTCVSGIVGITLAYMNYGAWSIVVQYLTNTIIDTIVLWFTIDWKPKKIFSFDRARTLISYGWKLLLSGLIDTGYTQIRGIIIGHNYSKSDLAFYNQGDKYPQLLVININSSISAVLFPEMSRFQDEKSKVKEITRKAIQISSYILWPMMFGFIAIARPFIELTITERWLPCVPYIQMFCISYGLWPIHTANLQAINALGHSEVFLKLEIIKKCIGLFSLIMCVNISPKAIAGSMIITGIISSFVNAFPNTKYLNYSIKEQLFDIMPSIILSGIMCLIIYPIVLLQTSNLIKLILQIVVGILVYIIGSIISKQKAYYYVLGLLNSVKQHQKKAEDFK